MKTYCRHLLIIPQSFLKSYKIKKKKISVISVIILILCWKKSALPNSKNRSYFRTDFNGFEINIRSGFCTGNSGFGICICH